MQPFLFIFLHWIKSVPLDLLTWRHYVLVGLVTLTGPAGIFMVKTNGAMHACRPSPVRPPFPSAPGSPCPPARSAHHMPWLQPAVCSIGQEPGHHVHSAGSQRRWSGLSACYTAMEESVADSGQVSAFEHLSTRRHVA